MRNPKSHFTRANRKTPATMR